MDRWQGKTAVVTGASAGIGAATCVLLADAGVRVVGLARRTQLVDDLQSKVKGTGTIASKKCDVANSIDVAAAFKWVDENFGGTHILINNAGVFYKGCITGASCDAMSEEAVLSTLDVNIKGTVMCARHAVTSMKKHGIDGHIVNINSIAGHYIPFSSNFNIYPASKHAVTAFTAALLNEFSDGDCKIKATSLSPGLVDTDLAGIPDSSTIPALKAIDIAESVIYVLSTPPHVIIEELTITPLKGKRL